MTTDHYQGKILVTQKIVITYNDKILALRRSHTDPALPLSWDIPGGVVEVGEHLEEAILREIQEETGIAIDKLHLFTVFDSSSTIHPYLICIGYSAEAQAEIVTLSYEHDQYEWITKQEFLSRNMKPHIKTLLEKFVF